MLEVAGLTAGYGDTTVLRDVSLSAVAGSVVALLGPNGAGKTTFLRVISGLVKPVAGRVVFDGVDVTGASATQMAQRGLCHVPEGRGIFPSLTVRENLALFAPRGRVKASLDRAASAFPIVGQRLGQPAGSLSGGEQQMLAIVRAYIANPRLVLVDEASMGLAPLVVEQLFGFLAQLSSHGTTLVVVEQYVSQALDLADSVYLLANGSIAFSGGADELSGAEIFQRYLGVEV